MKFSELPDNSFFAIISPNKVMPILVKDRDGTIRQVVPHGDGPWKAKKTSIRISDDLFVQRLGFLKDIDPQMEP